LKHDLRSLLAPLTERVTAADGTSADDKEVEKVEYEAEEEEEEEEEEEDDDEEAEEAAALSPIGKSCCSIADQKGEMTSSRKEGRLSNACVESKQGSIEHQIKIIA
jgi:hypothetical protein